jgi:hypothetical protein
MEIDSVVKSKVKSKFVTVLNQAPRHEDVWGEQKYDYTHFHLGIC